MGRFCSCFGKLATCFCFASPKKKCTDVEPSGDQAIGPSSTTPASTGIPHEPQYIRNSPTTGLSILSTTNPNDNRDIIKSSCTTNYSKDQAELVVDWTSGARKETTVINWKVQDFLALCELKELLRNETCIFTAGHTINKPTRWCFNLQRMKNEDNIGLFLKRLPPLSFRETIGNPSLTSDGTKTVAVSNSKENEPRNGDGPLAVAIPASEQSLPENSKNEDDDESVYIHYECIIKRSGHGDAWIHKRTCIPNFDIDQRLGFRKLFTMEDLKTADELSKSKLSPLLGEENTLHLEIKFTLLLKSVERTTSELNLRERFSLEWAKRYHADLLREEFKRLFISGLNADVILIIEAESDEKNLLAHKGVLAARSPVFAAMFQSGMKETSTGIVRIKDVSSKAMQGVLNYVYSASTDDHINWNDVREVEDLIYAADKYAVIGLRDFCDKMMFTGCENDNAMELLYLAQMHSMNVAAKEISLFIKMNANEIFSSS